MTNIRLSHSYAAALVGLMSGVLLATAQPVRAQTAQAPVEDIIVTARRRDETSLSVPVVISAIGAAELDRRAVKSMDDVARLVPAMIVGDNGSGHQGGIVSIRGLAGADSNPLADQAVSFNIDGIQVAKGSVRRMGEMDMTQIEVLKGPQALFFGKNSPAGIIVIHTADPTPNWQAGLTTGYEFDAREVRTTAYASGPVTDTFGIRLAGMMSDMQGWLKRTAPTTGVGVFGPETRRAPDTREYAGRLTAVWKPTDRFDAKLKLTYGENRGTSPTAATEIVACPLGRPQGSTTLDNCKPDFTVLTGSIGPNFGAVNPTFGSGGTSALNTQVLAGLEMNYNLTDELKLTSMTSFYKSYFRLIGNYTDNYLETQVLPAQILASNSFTRMRETTQELRLASNFAGRFNFMVGGLYQDSKSSDSTVTGRNALAPVFVNGYSFVQEGDAASVFGQATVEVLPKLELSGGARYSHESKSLPVAMGMPNFAVGLVNITGPNFLHNKAWNDVSPEATLNYRPTKELTFYGSYKQGFLSGGFNGNNAPLTPVAGGGFTTAVRSTYDQQKTKGFEVGAKALLLDGTLRTNLALYTYKTTGLQVTVTTAGTQVELRNAGSVRTKGAEWDATWRTPVEGLSLDGAVAYNDGKYLDYQASCYRGESSALCFNQVNRLTGQVALLQDLSGQRLVRAPQVSGNVGFNYDIPAGDNLIVGVSSNLSFSSGYWTDTTNTPGGWQKGYQLLDASLRLAQVGEKWEASLIGRNLTNVAYFQRSSDIPFTGSAPGAAPVGTLGDTAAFVNRGREIWIRLSYKFNG